MLPGLRILVLGAGGFVGRHLCREAGEWFGRGAKITKTGLHDDPASGLRSLNIIDQESVEAALISVRPTHIINLVGLAAPVLAQRDPELAWQLHAQAPDSLGRAILRHCPHCWLLHVGSGLVYGHSALTGKAMTEGNLLRPMDTYAVTKAAGDLALGALAGAGLKCLRLRPFNHIGPGQNENFVVAAFAAQVARIMTGRQEPVIRVGNLDAERDFLDVRDVVAAYGQLVGATNSLEPGAIYNIASGRAVSIRSVLQYLIELSGCAINIEFDQGRQRKSDILSLCGDATSLSEAVGWHPKHGLEQTLTDVLADFQIRLRNEVE